MNIPYPPPGFVATQDVDYTFRSSLWSGVTDKHIGCRFWKASLKAEDVGSCLLPVAEAAFVVAAEGATLNSGEDPTSLTEQWREEPLSLMSQSFYSSQTTCFRTWVIEEK